MSKKKQSSIQKHAKRTSILDAAARVFAQYGFKRTTMSDIADAGGVSRPALYLMFDNKEHLFRELAGYRVELALHNAKAELVTNRVVTTRFINAIKTFEKTYTEPVANSPHGDELIDVNRNLAADIMTKGRADLILALVKLLKNADKSDEVSFQNISLTHKGFVELLLSSIDGIKKNSTSKAEYRKRTQQLMQIFLNAIQR